MYCNTVSAFDWSLEKSEGQEYACVAELFWQGIVMVKPVEGALCFDHASGERIWETELARDQYRIPGPNFFERIQGPAPSFGRLPDMRPDDVILRVRVRSYVTDDGQIEQF